MRYLLVNIRHFPLQAAIVIFCTAYIVVTAVLGWYGRGDFLLMLASGAGGYLAGRFVFPRLPAD